DSRKKSGAQHRVSVSRLECGLHGADTINQWLGRHDEVTPDVMYMFSRRGGISIDKARRLLGYQPKVALEEGLRRSKAWLSETGQLS
ncbi:hypothetical protein, partial [Pseudomonas sp. UM16]|uniref:hypothetical protein n=1 Tax=Pseudomonas sp. UM16 TaxID=3158962 RepID=UPI003D0366D9